MTQPSTIVFQLQHIKSSSKARHAKLIGYYENELEIKNAVARMKRLPGFQKYQDDFIVTPFLLDEVK
jgi:hypothetical protein